MRSLHPLKLPHEKAYHQQNKHFSDATVMLCLNKDEKNRGIYLPFCMSLFILLGEAEEFHRENPSLSFFCLGPELCVISKTAFFLQCHVIRKRNIVYNI